MSSKKSQWIGTPSIVVQDVESIRRKGAQVYPTLSVDCIQVLPPACTSTFLFSTNKIKPTTSFYCLKDVFIISITFTVVDAYVSPLSLNYKAGVVHLDSIATTQVKSGKNVESKSGENSFTSVDIASTRGETSWLNGSTQSQTMTEEMTPNCFSLKTGLTKLTATLLATMTSSTVFDSEKKSAVVITIPDQTPIEIYTKKSRKRVKLDAKTMKDPNKCSKITVVLVVVALLACVAMGIVFYMEYVYKVDLLASRNRGNITSSSLVDLSVEVKEKYKDLLLGEWGESRPVSGEQESVTACASTEKGEIGGRVTAKMSENFMKRLNQAKPPA